MVRRELKPVLSNKHSTVPGTYTNQGSSLNAALKDQKKTEPLTENWAFLQRWQITNSETFILGKGAAENAEKCISIWILYINDIMSWTLNIVNVFIQI